MGSLRLHPSRHYGDTYIDRPAAPGLGRREGVPMTTRSRMLVLEVLDAVISHQRRDELAGGIDYEVLQLLLADEYSEETLLGRLIVNAVHD